MRPLLALLLLTAALAYGCSGDGDDNGGAAAIPTFTGAELVPESVYEEGDAFFGQWRTSEDVPDVQEYFEQGLADSGYRVVETRPIEDGVVIVVEETDDPAVGGTIVVRRDENSTRIVKTIGREDDDDDGQEEDGGGGSEEVTEGELPAGFPADVALPDDAEVISGSAPRVGESQYYLAEFSVTQSPADLIAYFNSTLPAAGWEAGASSEDPDALVLNYERDNDQVTVTGAAAGEGTNAAITVVLRD